MKKLLLTFLLIPFLSLITHSYLLITVYYNGTVIILAHNETQIYLPLENYTKIESNASFTYYNGRILTNSSSIVLQYNTKIDNEIKIDEPYFVNISIILPENAQITYLSTSPDSATLSKGLLNLTFYTSNLTTVFIIPSSPTTSSSNSTLFYIILVSFVLSLISTSFLLFLLVKNIRKGKVEEPILISGLDERDRMVLKAISDGADTIAKISKVTGLSRATVYRRVKKLVNLGYVKEIREGNKVRYEENKKEQ